MYVAETFGQLKVVFLLSEQFCVVEFDRHVSENLINVEEYLKN